MEEPGRVIVLEDTSSDDPVILTGGVLASISHCLPVYPGSQTQVPSVTTDSIVGR